MGRWLTIFGILIATVVAVNAVFVTGPAYLATKDDPRNSAVSMVAHLRWGVDPNTVVIDLIDIQPTASMADVTRTMLDIAQALKGRTFDKAQLSYRGRAKFQMDGMYFKKIGQERSWQNPIHTIRTMPENIQTVDGRPAFETWTGGWLGVLNRQMEDHSKLHRQWYLE